MSIVSIETDSKNDEKEISLDDRIKQFYSMVGDFEYSVYIYRKTKTGKWDQEGKEETLLDPHDVGIRFGPGEYRLWAKWKNEDGKWKDFPIYFSIGSGYKKLHREYLLEENQDLPFFNQKNNSGGLLEQLGFKGGSPLETVQTIAAIVAVVREAFPRNDGPNVSDLLRIQQENNQNMMNILMASKGESDKYLPLVLSTLGNSVNTQLEATQRGMEFANKMNIANAQNQNNDDSKLDKFIALISENIDSIIKMWPFSTPPRKYRKDFDEIKADPEKVAYMLDELESRVGKQKTDKLASRFELNKIKMQAGEPKKKQETKELVFDQVEGLTIE